ncbi:hypothetical protein SE17_02110 [Kouleothrix aurantiaca]|uniref:Uncharacterized protein n=1 Tax=Kouleothrix aurantiaca TaxID=186479 RepID=A0A0P9FDB5_9CHLR|nr:hypothetical protein SE17_02110 [Kouleothrix aurantiaca]
MRDLPDSSVRTKRYKTPFYLYIGSASGSILLWQTKRSAMNDDLAQQKPGAGTSAPTRRINVALDQALLRRCAPYGSQTEVVEQALRAFFAAPDTAVPRSTVLRETVGTTSVDRQLIMAVKWFALDREVERGRRVSQRAVIEEIVRAYLDARDAESRG